MCLWGEAKDGFLFHFGANAAWYVCAVAACIWIVTGRPDYERQFRVSLCALPSAHTSSVRRECFTICIVTCWSMLATQTRQAVIKHFLPSRKCVQVAWEDNDTNIQHSHTARRRWLVLRYGWMRWMKAAWHGRNTDSWWKIWEVR